MKVNIDEAIMSSGMNAELNTWKRYNKTMPNISKVNNKIVLRTSDGQVEIGHTEESIFMIIIEFSYSPVWLIKKWLESFSFTINTFDPNDIIKSWISMGLVWCEGTVTGEYLRPTYLLFSIFKMKPYQYSSIPYNQLTHSISEQQVMFDVMTGSKNNIINKKFESIFMPKYSPIGLGTNKNGTNIISEKDFKPLSIYQPKNIVQIESAEHRIREQIRNKENVTLELEDFSKFAIIKKNSNTGVIKEDYDFHIPDLIIPILRKNGVAQSIAIELELSPKSLQRYIHTLEKYKDNYKFGHIVWYSINGKINDLLNTAYEKVGGLGQASMHIFEFVVPSPSDIYKIK